MASAVDIKSITSLKLLFGVALLYVVYKAVQRLFFHPLSKVPGPWYAAISTVYEFWWDCPKNGKYMFKIEEMHKTYGMPFPSLRSPCFERYALTFLTIGPIVRVNPWEAHINDPAFMDVLWSSSKLEKDPFFYGGFGVDSATVSTVSPELHRIRRGAMAQYFSKANVLKLEPRVLSRVKQLCERVKEHGAEDKVIDISNAFRCLTTDVTTDYVVPKTRNYLAHPDFNAVFNRVVRDTAGIINWNRHIRILYPIVTSIPRSLVAFFDKEGSSVAIVDNQAVSTSLVI